MLTFDSMRRDRILIELGGSEAYFLISLRLERLEVVMGRSPGELGRLDPSCVWKTLRLLARAKSFRKHRVEFDRRFAVEPRPSSKKPSIVSKFLLECPQHG